MIWTILLIVYIAICIYFNLIKGKCACEVDLSGKTAIITGSNGGIGKETAKELSRMGATIIMGCRKSEKSNQALEEIKKYSNNDKVYLFDLDLSDTSSIRDFVQKIKEMNFPIHILVNNAGVMNYSYQVTKRGIESNIAVNHLGHFLLTTELISTLIENKARIINLSSNTHEIYLYGDIDITAWTSNKLSRFQLYPQSKVVNILFTKELQRRYGDKGIKAYAVHPGVVRTEIARSQGWLAKMLAFTTYPPLSWTGFFKSSMEGAQTTIHCAISSEVENSGSCYFTDCKETRSSKLSNNRELAERVWRESLLFV